MKERPAYHPLSEVPWDSEFFGLKIGRGTLTGPQDWKAWEAEAQRFDLVYVFAEGEGDDGELPPDASLADVKVIYRRSLDEAFPAPDASIGPYTDSRPDEDMYALAIHSGLFSRYKTDPRFPAGSFERMYRLWMEKSVSGELARVVLCCREGKRPIGMFTLQIKGDEAVIGLVAVHPSFAGRGIGRALMQAVLYYAREHHCTSISVATQEANAPACSFYRKMGFDLVSRTRIYHWWTKG